MEDILFLKQKIEFMQLELDDAKSREAQLKSMYDSMLKSLSYDSPRLTSSSSVELKSAEERYTQERTRIKTKYKEKLKALQKQCNDFEAKKNSSEEQLRDQTELSNKIKTVLEKEINLIKEQKKDLESKIAESADQFSKMMERKNEIIFKLKNEIEHLKRENAEDISRITEETNRSIMELKTIYEQEKPRKSLENIDTYEKLKSEFHSLQEIIKSLESSESNLKDQLKMKDEHIEKISRKLRLRAGEDSKSSDLMKAKDSLSEKLIDKEIEISKLKKIIGELKLEINYGVSKPPIHSPKNNRSMTFINKPDSPSPEPFCYEKQEEYRNLKQYERMILSAHSIECELCYHSFTKSAFYDHILNCQLDNSFSKSPKLDKSSLDKAQELENQVEILKLALGKLKNQRDKAKIETEKLLMQLKQVKLEWALSEESSDEKIMEMKKELKNLIEILCRINKDIHLPQEFTFEIDLALQNTDRFFGGRLSKSFMSGFSN